MFKKHPKIKLFMVILLAMVASFLLGYFSKIDTNISHKTNQDKEIANNEIIIINTEEPFTPRNTLYVASKRGSKYYLPWCDGAEALSEENKVYFKSDIEAVEAGYEKAQNCPGL